MFFGSRTFVPVNWMCKKQTSVSHSSTESDFSLDASLRMDGLPALDLWDIVIELLRSPQTNKEPSIRVPGNGNEISKVSQSKKNQKGRPRVPGNGNDSSVDNCFKWITCPATHNLLKGIPSFSIFEDNEAVIKMIIKGRSPTVRHVSRTHRAALDWLFDRINFDPKIQIGCVDTKNQLADI